MADTKNLCAQIPVDLHRQVREHQEESGKSLGEYMTWLITTFYQMEEDKQLKQRQSTRQLMGVRKVLPHGVAVSGGCLVFFLIHPDNLSVLSAEGIPQRVTALSNLFRAE